MSDQMLFPVFLRLEGRRVLLVGGGAMAAARLGELTRAGAYVTVVAPVIRPAILSFGGVIVLQREFAPSDLDHLSPSPPRRWVIARSRPPRRSTASL
jgi:siroheme synthase (precorrin-2 oxidase/ferrochelatase)